MKKKKISAGENTRAFVSLANGEFAKKKAQAGNGESQYFVVYSVKSRAVSLLPSVWVLAGNKIAFVPFDLRNRRTEDQGKSYIRSRRYERI